jgi:exosome complex component MTR3
MYPKSQIDVYVTILEDDGSALAAALTVSGLALANGAIHMFDSLVGASLVR